MQTKLNNKVYLIDINYSFKKHSRAIISQKSKKNIFQSVLIEVSNF